MANAESTAIDTGLKRCPTRKNSLIVRNGRTYKRCQRCQKTKAASAFNRRTGRASGLMSHCKSCLLDKERKNRKRFGSQPALGIPEALKCKHCGETKPVSEFHRRRERKRGYDYHCKQCHVKRLRSWRAKNPDREILYKDRYTFTRKVIWARNEAMRFGCDGSHSADQFRAKCDLWGWCCYLCGEHLDLSTIETEHRKPFSLGGTNWAANIAPACKSCNSSKNNRTDVDYRSAESIAKRMIPAPSRLPK